MPYPKELLPNFIKKIPLGTKSNRIVHNTTFQSSASPGETLYITCPELGAGVLLVPNTLNLVFNLTLFKADGSDIADSMAAVVQNVSKNLVSKCVLKYQSEVIFDSTHPQLIETYRDLYRHNKSRANDTLYGIQSENLRKVRSGTVAAAAGTDDELLYGVYGTKYALKLDHPMITDHGCISPCHLKNIEWELTLTCPKLLITSDGDVGYKLTNIELEYETIIDTNLAAEIYKSYLKRAFLYEYVTWFSESRWKQSETLLMERVNVPRRSLKGILILFTIDQPKESYDSEQFINPKITSVTVEIEGIPSRIFSQGYKPRDLWREARRYFAQDVSNHDIDMSEVKFLRDKFCLFIDTRSFPAVEYHGQGMAVLGKQTGIHITMRKEDTSTVVNIEGEEKTVDLNIKTHIYALSDSQITLENSLLKSIMF